MHRIDSKNATNDGLFTDGDPHQPEEEVATYLDASWLNAVQEELCSVIASNEIELQKGKHSQLNTAISKAIDSKLEAYQPIQDNADEIEKIKELIGQNRAAENKDYKENLVATIMERLDALEDQAKTDSKRISGLESEQNTYTSKTDSLEQRVSGHTKNLEPLNAFKRKLDANLSIDRFEKSFIKNGEKIKILSERSQCSGVILLHVTGKNGDSDYLEYDFKCRIGKSSYYGSENLVWLSLREHSQVSASLKSYGVRCRLIDNEIYLEQEGVETKFPHEVNCRIIGWVNG